MRFDPNGYPDIPKVVPLTCHGHSRPVTHLSFSSTVEDEQYYLISACKGTLTDSYVSSTVYSSFQNHD